MDAWKNAFALSLVISLVMFLALCVSGASGCPSDILLSDGICVLGAFGITLYAGVKWWRGDAE